MKTGPVEAAVLAEEEPCALCVEDQLFHHRQQLSEVLGHMLEVGHLLPEDVVEAIQGARNIDETNESKETWEEIAWVLAKKILK